MDSFLAVSLAEIPWYAWGGLFLVVVFFLGDRVLWDYEVKFPFTAGVGRGEVELESLKQKGTQIEVKLTLEPECQGADVEVLLNDQLLHTVAADRVANGRVRVRDRIPLEEPTEGDIVTIRIRGEAVLSGPLIRD